ncbi:MAG: single-stranded DNA-binding protein [Solirubrobacterales bacterium]
MAENINRVTVTGNLTADPELRHTGSGTAVCQLRIAVNGRRKDGDQWVDKPNYFNVTVWGAQGQNCANYLSKGRPVAVDGRLDWREWEAKDGSGKRQTVEIVAETVQFLGSRDGSAPGGGGNAGGGGGGFTPKSDVPADTGDFNPAGGGGAADDDIPF